jgi:hypothetical protein
MTAADAVFQQSDWRTVLARRQWDRIRGLLLAETEVGSVAKTLPPKFFNRQKKNEGI